MYIEFEEFYEKENPDNNKNSNLLIAKLTPHIEEKNIK